jgi:NADH-quinone oxidoreductase subunit L
VYLLVRTNWLFALTPDVLLIVGWVGAITALMAAILACVQTDIKRVLAYSTVSQLGYMMTAIGAGFAAAGFFHLLTHGVFKALLFLGAGAVIHAVGTNDIRQMGGLVRRMPQTAVVFIVGTLSLAGIPLFGGFLSKEQILGAVWSGGLQVPFAMLLLGAFLTAFYMFRVVFLTFFGPHGAPGTAHGAPSTGTGTAHVAPSTEHGSGGDPSLVMSAPLWILALLSAGIGVMFTFSHPGTPFEPPAWLTPAAVLTAVGGIVLAWLTYQRGVVRAERLAAAFGPIRQAALAKFWIDDVFLFGYRAVMLSFSRVVGWVDRYLVDGVLNAASAWTVAAGNGLRRVQTGRVQDYLYGVAIGVLALVYWVRWVL